MSDLDRFLKAQEDDYQKALKEIKNGKKVSCWMWYIFPQIVGLGMTQMSKHYGIKNVEEAIDYLKNEILRKRLIEISQALLDLDEDEYDDIREIMGFPDDLKLKSCMTLFKKVEELSGIDCDNVFNKVLERFYRGEEDNKTLTILEKQKYEKEKKNNNSDKNIDNTDNNSSKEEKEREEERKSENESEERDIGDEDKKEDSKNNNNSETNNINSRINNKKKIQHLDSIDTLSEESVEKSDKNSEKEKKYENERNNMNNDIKNEKIDEFLGKSEKINNDENEIISHVKKDRIPNLKNDDENNDLNKSKCSFCPDINICNIM